MSDEPRDSELEEEFRQLAARLEPVPPSLLQAAAGAFSWRDLDSELAELVFDSLLQASDATLVRGAPQRRLLSFRAGELGIEVEVTRRGSERTLLGQIAPPQPAQVDIRRGGEMITVEADELGRFRCEPLPAGPLSLRLRPPAGLPRPPVVTDWLTI